MKHLQLPFLAFAALLLFGCDASHIDNEERDSIVRRLAETYYWNAAGQDGYEFVSLEEIKATTYQDNIDYRRQYIQQLIDENEKMVLVAQQKLDTFPDLLVNSDTAYYVLKIEEYQGKADRYKQVLAGIDSLATSLGDSSEEVASYTYRYTLKAKNEQGQPNTFVFFLQTDPGYGVLQFSPDTADLYPNPNDFPGYREMAGRVLGE